MREYELFYLVGEKNEAELPAIRTAVEAAVTGAGGSFLPPETTDKRKLAYEIQGQGRGTYIARRFTLPDGGELVGQEFEQAVAAQSGAVDRIQATLSLMNNILRVLVVRAERLPELKQIERTEYAKRETRGRGGRPVTPAAPRPMAAKDAPLPNRDKEAPTVSKEEIDKKLGEVLDI